MKLERIMTIAILAVGAIWLVAPAAAQEAQSPLEPLPETATTELDGQLEDSKSRSTAAPRSLRSSLSVKSKLIPDDAEGISIPYPQRMVHLPASMAPASTDEDG